MDRKFPFQKILWIEDLYVVNFRFKKFYGLKIYAL
jgi:hypothetical protein